MTLTAQQSELFRAIDSKDFGNVAECLNKHGAIAFPGVTFHPLPDGQVLLEYEPNHRDRSLFELVAKFQLRYTRLINAANRGQRVRVPAQPRFRIARRTRNNPILIST